MSYKIGDRVLHDSGWSALIKSGTNETGFTIEFDGCVIPENSEPLLRGPQDQYKMMGVFSRNLEPFPKGKICSSEDTKQWRDKVDSAWQKELQERKQEREQDIQKINRSRSRSRSKNRTRNRSKSKSKNKGRSRSRSGSS